jgi:hypothetical protein
MFNTCYPAYLIGSISAWTDKILATPPGVYKLGHHDSSSDLRQSYEHVCVNYILYSRSADDQWDHLYKKTLLIGYFKLMLQI